MNMEVKSGYKQTSVGMIPADWNVCCIDKLGELQMGKGLLKSDISLFGDIPAIPYTSLYTDFSEVIDPVKITWFTTKEVAPYIVSSPCVLFASSSNVSANTGKACALKSGFPVAVGREVISFRTNQNVAFISYLLGTSFYRKKTLDLAKGITIKHVYPATFIGYEIALPSLTEQCAIADALDNINELICGLDKLIAKKRDIQQATMQQLLTAQRRLSGFSGEWEVKRLVDIADIDPESLPGNTQPDHEFRYISLEDVDEGTLTGFSELCFREAPSRARRRLRQNDILISTVRPNLKSHLHFKISEANWVCSTGFSVVRCMPGIADSGYIFFHLFAHHVNKQIEALITGSNYPAINSGDVRNLTIPMPKIEEQTAIATILSDMDSELAAIEAHREKARHIKQGMMQVLLTGRIRLSA